MIPVKTIEWKNGTLRIIDQTRLPGELHYLTLDSIESLAEAIRSLRVRGAPAIGVAAALGVAMAAGRHMNADEDAFRQAVDRAVADLRQTRPTAVNLFWALDRMQRCVRENPGRSTAEMADLLEKEALAVRQEDLDSCRRMGRHGAALLPGNATVMTHCNAGALATAGYGTALGVIYAAREAGKTVRVFADETRPLLQGARLTAWELHQAGIPVTVICDAAAGSVMSRESVDAVIVGADRIAANGDTANKIGTYPLAVLASRHRIPFYVAAPLSTVDLSLASGEDIPIEQRDPGEVTRAFGMQTAPPGVEAANPAFDVTPHELVTAVITDAGVIRPPFDRGLIRAVDGFLPRNPAI